VEPVARPISAAALPLDQAGRIDADIPCRKCGYNLRGLLPDGVCPECATAVGRSLHGDLLRFCDPDWVQTLASGMNWIVAGIVLSVVLGCLGTGVSGAFGMIRTWTSATSGATVAVQLGVGLVSLIGYWKFTSPDPTRSGVERFPAARSLVRAAQVVDYVSKPASALLASAPKALALPVMIADAAVGIVGIFAVFTYARQLALRIPDDSLARQIRIVMLGMTAVFVLMLITGVSAALLLPSSPSTPITAIMPSAAPTTTAKSSVSVSSMQVPTPGSSIVKFGGRVVPPGSPVATILPIGWCGGGVAMMVFGIWLLVLIGRLRKSLNEAALMARQTWAAAPGTSNPTP